MAHLWVMAESIPRNFDEYLGWLKTRHYTNGSRPFIREIRFFDINVKEKDMPELLNDIKPAYGAGHIGVGRIEKVIKWIRRLFGTKLQEVNMDKVEGNYNNRDSYKGNWIYIVPLGWLKDEPSRTRPDEYEEVI